MSLRVAPLKDDADSWDEFVARRGCLYQSWGFSQCLREGIGHRILRLGASDDSGLRACLSLALIKSPLFGRFAVSLPVSDHAGLCYEDEAAAAALLNELPALLREEGLDSLELRQLRERPPLADLPRSEHKLTLELELPQDSELLWKELKAKVRNLVRKGQKLEMDYRQGSEELLDTFYTIYARNLRDLGTPCYPKRFFAALLRHFPGKAAIHIATLPPEDLPIAVGFTLQDQRRQQIPFAASLTEYRRHAPNMFLYWKILEDAIERGCTVFDFGRSTRDSGTHRFKKQWGATERPLPWSYQLARGAEIPDTRVDSPRYRLAIQTWKKLPVAVSVWMSERIVRFLP
ncbi:MAG TPA: FemAB family XrtA/PEP-CTERM system-associated protein [Candidatus Krumholzibacteria bacterium]|nr:FemAB family XrtA/PEP-CTERM system-associated protein [Candidatus Krumholzibacteria bacterium]